MKKRRWTIEWNWGYAVAHTDSPFQGVGLPFWELPLGRIRYSIWAFIRPLFIETTT